MIEPLAAVLYAVGCVALFVVIWREASAADRRQDEIEKRRNEWS